MRPGTQSQGESEAHIPWFVIQSPPQTFSSLPTFCSFGFFQTRTQASDSSGPLLVQALLPEVPSQPLPLPPPRSHPLLRKPSRTPRHSGPPARGLPCCFTASVTVLPSLVAWGSFQLWLPRDVAGMRRNTGNGQEAVSGSGGEAITWTTVGLRRWGHGPTGRCFWTGRWDKQGGGEKGHSRKLVSGLRSWRHLFALTGLRSGTLLRTGILHRKTFWV